MGVGPQTPDGLLAKIDLVHLAPGCRINLTTSPDATLADLVPGKDVTVRGFKQIASGSAEAGLDVQRPVSKALACSAGAGATVSGSFDLDISPSFTAHVSALHGLTSARFSLDGDAKVTVTGQAAGSSGCALKRASVLSKPLRLGTFEGTIGGWPVVVTILADATVDADLHAEARLRTSVTASAGLAGGIAYDATKRTRFSAIPLTPHASLSYDPPTVSGSAGAAIHVRPSVEALLYGIAGPKVTVTTGAEFHADPRANPWWTLDAPFGVAASLTSHVLDLSSPELSLYAHTRRLADAHGPFRSGGGPTVGGGSTPPAPTPSAWTTLVGPSPLGSAYAWTPNYESDLSRAVVGCPAAGECVAVGGGRDAEDRPALVIYTEHDGVWTHAAAPLPANADTSVYTGTMARAAVNALSCPVVGTCVAVGSYTALGTPDGPVGPTLPLILQERNGVWSPTSVIPANAAMPPTGSPLAELQAISCPAANQCVAAGTYHDNSGTSYPNDNTGPWHGMFAMQTDSGWTVEEAPLPDGADDYGYVGGGTGIQAISCPAVGECVAPARIANAQINGGRLAGLLYTYSGGQWSVEEAPLPPGVAPGQDTVFLGGSQAGISCPAVGACVVVGEGQDGATGIGRGFLLQQGETGWTAQDTGSAELNAVSCPAVHACGAAGLGAHDGVAVMTQTSDGQWVAGTQPPIDVLEGSMARDITCWKAQHCVVLGRHGGGDFYSDTGYVATRSGDSWETSEMPIPAADTAPSGPVGAACTPDGYCAVIGWAADATSRYHENGVLMTGTPPGG